jgi:hypothetical protein
MNRPTHRCSAHLHAMLSFPPLAIVLLARIGVCFQQLLHSHLQGHSFLRRPPWNGPRQNGSCFASLLQIALDGRPRHLEEIHDLHSGDSFVNCAKHLLSQILWIGSHTPILSPGSIFLQALVHKLPLGDATDLPVSKSGSAAHFEAKVVAHRLIAEIHGEEPANGEATYDGEVMCFLETGQSKATQLVFNYEHPPHPPRPSRYYHMEKQLFNRAYWHLVPQGLV